MSDRRAFPTTHRFTPPQPLEAANDEFDVVVRPLRSGDDFRACVELQKLTWGEEFTELVPLSILKVSQRIGGVAAGAFDGEGRMLGFVFGMSGVENGEIVHWSDMLAVHRDARNLGVGQKLKHFQADALRPLGVTRIYWTYDPLVARNAHLNLNRLGVKVVEYVPEMYSDTESDLHRGLGTDRFIVAWHLDASAEEAAATRSTPELPRDIEYTPIVNAETGDGERAIDESAPVVRVEIPVDIEVIQRVSLAEAARWRKGTRSAFLDSIERGYRVVGFYREDEAGPCYYMLAHEAPQPAEE